MTCHSERGSEATESKNLGGEAKAHRQRPAQILHSLRSLRMTAAGLRSVPDTRVTASTRTPRAVRARRGRRREEKTQPLRGAQRAARLRHGLGWPRRAEGRAPTAWTGMATTRRGPRAYIWLRRPCHAERNDLTPPPRSCLQGTARPGRRWPPGRRGPRTTARRHGPTPGARGACACRAAPPSTASARSGRSR
jgi:hypothetical protein